MPALTSDPNAMKRTFAAWLRDPSIAENVAHFTEIPARAARLEPFPSDMKAPIRAALEESGIPSLYAHQARAWELYRQARDIVVATGTASGKSLCYLLPILDSLLSSTDERFFLIFPTKALANDQLTSLRRWLGWSGISPALVGLYDGDTSASIRQLIRSGARVVLTNPDMLHTGILPHHTLWAEFFRRLRAVVIDEIHIYRGVFGSHVANVLRRLKRVAAHYGAFPSHIMTSATIANPLELAAALVENPVEIIDEDGSPQGARYFVTYNPPLVHEKLGIRASSIQEAVRLACDLFDRRHQTLIFTRTRRSVELLLRYLRERSGASEIAVQGYRSGYLPEERRQVEEGLRDGSVRAVVATNALELGIDIGGMESAILVGYPGSIASLRQQAGRAGRRAGSSLAVLVASADPLDQYLMAHPEYILEQSPEQALIDPNNLLILLQHIRCAAFELPFTEGKGFGQLSAHETSEILKLLAESGELHRSGNRYFWSADRYPASTISLRSTSPNSVVLHSVEEGDSRLVGVVDAESAPWMIHPDAVYLHAGQSYLVRGLDLEHGRAELTPASLDYFTEPQISETAEIISTLDGRSQPPSDSFFGDVRLRRKVTGFRRLRWYTREIIDEQALEMPETELVTTGFWLALNERTVNALRDAGLWNSYTNQYGSNWDQQRRLARQRDDYRCRACGAREITQSHHVHHIVPFKLFSDPVEANRLENLVTLCPTCHRAAEISVRVRSGLAGLSYILLHLAPLSLMCDIGDLGVYTDPQCSFAEGRPLVMFYDQIPAGIGLSRRLFETVSGVIHNALQLVDTCPCQDGCPSCVGPSGLKTPSGKRETRALLAVLSEQSPL